MQKTTFVNPFAAMKLEKQIRIAKGKQAFLQRVEQLRSQKRKLQHVENIVTTIY